MTFGKETFVDFQRSSNSLEKAKKLSQNVLDNLVWMNESSIGIFIRFINAFLFEKTFVKFRMLFTKIG